MTNPLDTEPLVCLYTDVFRTAGSAKREIFHTLLSCFVELTVAPNRLAVSGPKGMSGIPRTFDRFLPELEDLGFDNVRTAVMYHDRRGRRSGAFTCSWVAGASMSIGLSGFVDQTIDRMSVFFGASANDTNRTQDDLLSVLEKVLPLFGPSYGYVLRLRRGAAPEVFNMRADLHGADKFRSHDETLNRRAWTGAGVYLRWHLRDVYPVNVVGREMLHRRIEGRTLEEWILADRARGTLVRLSEALWSWRPVVKNIPHLREPLFRANLLHWHGFYDNFQFDDTQFDPAVRFQIPAETPAMFKPEFWEGKDPGITN